ncbi:hypothetical protein LDENG_00058590 [Lucifuga dentata]|nr:hypothetical protein LDENG_00058590 [Lucifuga dentata]
MLPLGQLIANFNISYHFYANDIQIKACIGSLGSCVKSSVRNLGVILDSSLSLDAHVRQLTCSSFFHLRNIAKLRAVVSKTELKMVIHAFISSRLDYCNSLLTCLSKTSLNRLQTVQNAAARLLTKANRRSHITPILSGFHWLPVNFRVYFKILVLTFRALHGQAPPYLVDLIQTDSASRSLRSSGQKLLVIPRTCLKTRGDHAFWL